MTKKNAPVSITVESGRSGVFDIFQRNKRIIIAPVVRIPENSGYETNRSGKSRAKEIKRTGTNAVSFAEVPRIIIETPRTLDVIVKMSGNSIFKADPPLGETWLHLADDTQAEIDEAQSLNATIKDRADLHIGIYDARYGYANINLLQESRFTADVDIKK